METASQCNYNDGEYATLSRCLGEGRSKADRRRRGSADGVGSPWLTPEWFRFGASALANDILRQLFRLKTGRYMAGYDFSEA